jgi:uncharacterized protein YjeT (DUF2065 family)
MNMGGMVLPRTRLSLFYVAGYLVTGGTAFLLNPDLALKIFFATGVYDEVMVRFVGLLLLALGILVVQIIRHRVEVLYRSTLVVRTIILVSLVLFYAFYRDPLMLVLSFIVGVGYVATWICMRLDSRDLRPS